jgi:CubicO group peptidase (beta-lactamase class C family)
MHLEMERLVEAYREKEGAPAVSAAALMPDGAVTAAARGWADLENEVAATPGSMFRLASLSKPLTAATALRLAEAGLLDLDAPVEKYVPSWPRKPWPVTVRQLLGHLGGVRDYREDRSDADSTVHYWSVREALTVFSADPLAHEPGTRYLYTSHGYALAAAAMEGAAGAPYADLVAGQMLRPAGIETIRPDDVFALIPNRARGYRKAPTGEIQNCPLADTSVRLPGGGWAGTASGVAKFAKALMEGRLLGEQWFEKMLERQRLKDGSRTGYGLGLGIIRDRAPRVFGHSGGLQGASTYMVFSPEAKTAAVVLANLEGLNPQGLAEALLAEAGA